jgi:hypothetical protein
MRAPLLLLFMVPLSCGAASDLSYPGEVTEASGPTDGGPDLLAPAGDAAQSGPVDGISCDSTEQLLFHIHAHLAVYAGEQQKLIPAEIGIAPGVCIAWLHTHDTSGVIHIESPVERTFTLGDFFDVWGQPLSSTQVGPVQGAVTATLDGQPYASDPRTIPLDAHAVIQLDVGTPLVAPQPYTFPTGL